MRNKDRHVRAFAVFTVLMVAFYLMCAFIEWDYNPGHWAEISRVGFAVTGGTIALFLGAVFGYGV